jgi:pyruvate formate lyase activating enzyme
MTIDTTEIGTLKRAYDIAKKKLKYVYIGNVPAETGGSDTMCPKCGHELIKRKNYSTSITGLDGNKCANCGETIKGVFE